MLVVFLVGNLPNIFTFSNVSPSLFIPPISTVAFVVPSPAFISTCLSSYFPVVSTSNSAILFVTIKLSAWTVVNVLVIVPDDGVVA